MCLKSGFDAAAHDVVFWQERACAALANLACGDRVKAVMAQKGAIQPLVYVCRSDVGFLNPKYSVLF